MNEQFVSLFVGGESVRTRACDNPIPRNGGLDCVGPNHETMTCNDQHCRKYEDESWFLNDVPRRKTVE